jgi:replicative DNA helicase
MTEEKQDRNEIALIAGAILQPAHAAEAARIVKKEDILEPRLRLIWGAIIDLISEGETEIDIMRIARKTSSRPPVQQKIALYMSEVIEGYPKVTSLLNVAERVHRRATLRAAMTELREIGLLIKDELQSTDGNVEDLEERLAKLAIAVSSRSDTLSRRSTYADRIQDIAKHFDALSCGPLTAMIPTGIPKLDRKLGGGLRPGQLHTILGGTGSGKTALASQIADEAVKRGHRSMMFSMEVDDVDVYLRDVERRAGRSRWDLLPHKPSVTRDKAQEALYAAMAEMAGESDHKVVYSEPMSVEGIRQAVLTENLRHGKVDVVVVDHAQVALPSDSEVRNRPRYLEVKGTAEGLRALARNLGVVVVLTAQLNPPPKGEKPDMSQVRESKDINNCSEVVMVIEHQKEAVDDDIVIHQSYIHLDKVRAGFTGKVPVVYRGEVFRFEDQYQGEDE